MNDQLIFPSQIIDDQSNGKQTMIVMSRQDYEQEISQKTLTGIVRALGLLMEKDVTIQTVDKTEAFNFGPALIGYSHVLLFGVNPKTIGLQMDAKVYKIYSFESFKMIIAHPLSFIANDLKTKQGLWKILQVMYNLT